MAKVKAKVSYVCQNCGYVTASWLGKCPECGKDAEVWSRVVGYLRPVRNYNKGKQEEYAQRKKYVINE